VLYHLSHYLTRIVCIVLVSLVFLSALSPAALASKQADSTIVLLHFNDFYEINGYSGKGGLQPLSRIIEQQKQRYPESIVSFGGDLLSPSIYSSTSKGRHMVNAMALLHVDIAVAGNHEFDFGLPNAISQFKTSLFPWLLSNTQPQFNSLKDSIVQTYIHEINGIKVGFFGLLTPEASVLSRLPSNFIASNIIQSARQMVTQLQAQNVDMIVALTHLDLEQDKALASQVNHIDLILGGHDHYPVSLVLNDTLILKAGLNGEYLGVIKASITAKKQKKSTPKISWEFISTRDEEQSTKSDNQAVHNYLSHYNQLIKKKKQQQLALTKLPLDAKTLTVRSKESNFANLITDALRLHYKTDVALLNGGAIRNDKYYPADTSLTELDILSALPFANRAVVVKITGKQLTQMLEHGLSAIEYKSGRFLQLSGIDMEYSATEPSGKRIKTVRINKQPIENEKHYTLTTADYIYHGGDGFKQLQNSEVIVAAEAGELITNIVTDYLISLKQIKSISMGRIQEAQ